MRWSRGGNGEGLPWKKKKLKNEINFVKFPKIGHRPPSNKIIPQNLPPPTKQNFVSGSMPEMCHHGLVLQTWHVGSIKDAGHTAEKDSKHCGEGHQILGYVILLVLS